MKGKPPKGTVSASDVIVEVRPGVYERRDGSGYLLEQVIKPGEIMKHRRRELRMSMQELGDAIGVSKSTISRYESGEIEKLPVSYLTPIAEALQVDPLYLLGAVEKHHVSNGATLEIVPVPTVEDSAFSYAKSETDLLVEKYKDAPEHIKEAIRTMLQME